MSCCGRNRMQIRASAPTHDVVRRVAAPYFQYLGRTGMTARGPATGRAYRFAGHGTVLAVDPRDRRGLSSVPNLRQVAGP
jgi:hypothetical protein